MKRLVNSTKFIVNRTKIINLLFLCTISFALFTSSALAQSPSPTPKATPTPTPKVTATPSATPKESSPTSDVRDKVRQTIENLTHKPKATIGTLDQVSDSTLQIKGKDDKLFQVATTGQTSYSRVKDNKKSEIKFTDLAIGDYLVALGYKNGNGVLEAKRVIAYEKEVVNTTKAFWASVDNNTKGTLKVSLKNDEGWTIETSKNTQVLSRADGKLAIFGKIDDLIAGDRIIAIGQVSEKKDKTLTADKIIALSLILKSTGSPTPKATVRPTASPKASPIPTSSPTP